MKCPKCGGAGYIYNNLVGYTEDCFVCHGTGELLTNEEWFCQLSTEEKAKWITENLSVYADSWVKSDEKLLNPITWEEWLKEKHNEM